MIKVMPKLIFPVSKPKPIAIAVNHVLQFEGGMRGTTGPVQVKNEQIELQVSTHFTFL